MLVMAPFLGRDTRVVAYWPLQEEGAAFFNESGRGDRLIGSAKQT